MLPWLRPNPKPPALVNNNTTATPQPRLLLRQSSSHSHPAAHSRTLRKSPQTNTLAKPSTPQTANQPWTNRRKAQTSRRPSPSLTSAATAVSHSATWATSSEHAARTLLWQRSRTLRLRWAATVREYLPFPALKRRRA